MNFDFLKECQSGTEELCGLLDAVREDLEAAEQCYFQSPRESGIFLRRAAEKICLIYNAYYELGFPAETSLEGFLCYTGEEAHNASVSRFLSAVRKEQRDRLNKLRVLGDDCMGGEAAPDRGMAFSDRMAQNARRMMETVMEVLKELCQKVYKRETASDIFFSEERMADGEDGHAKSEDKQERQGLFGFLRAGIFSRKN